MKIDIFHIFLGYFCCLNIRALNTEELASFKDPILRYKVCDYITRPSNFATKNCYSETSKYMNLENKRKKIICLELHPWAILWVKFLADCLRLFIKTNEKFPFDFFYSKSLKGILLDLNIHIIFLSPELKKILALS